MLYSYHLIATLHFENNHVEHLFRLHRKKVVRRVRRLNPLTNAKALLRLNPYAAVLKRQAILSAQKRSLAREELLAKKRGVSKILCRKTLLLVI